MSKIMESIRTKTAEDIRKEIATIKKEIDARMVQTVSKAEKDTNSISKKRKRLARLLSVLSENK